MNERLIKSGEAAEPLGDGFVILQRRDLYRFGSDSVALAKFAARDIRRGHAVLDLCSGCGIVGILIAIETDASVTGAELDETLYDMSVRSAELNGLSNVAFVRADLREQKRFALDGGKRFDAVVCNPPFYKATAKPSAVSPAANSELTVTFCNVAEAAANSLGNGGAAYFVHTATRLDEILCECRERKLMPKELVVNRNGKTFLLKCVKGGKSGLKTTVEEF